jgi:hypothetical protein
MELGQDIPTIKNTEVRTAVTANPKHVPLHAYVFSRVLGPPTLAHRDTFLMLYSTHLDSLGKCFSCLTFQHGQAWAGREMGLTGARAQDAIQHWGDIMTQAITETTQVCTLFIVSTM